jgi:hypothetical protein
MREFAGKMPQASWSTLIKHRPLHFTPRTPQCGHAVWGKKAPNQQQSVLKRDSVARMRIFRRHMQHVE